MATQRQFDCAAARVQELDDANGELRISQRTIENERNSAIVRSLGLESQNQQLDNENENERLRIANMRISELEQQNVELCSENRHLLSSQELINIGLDHDRMPEQPVQALEERIRQSNVINSGLRGSYQTVSRVPLAWYTTLSTTVVSLCAFSLYIELLRA